MNISHLRLFGIRENTTCCSIPINDQTFNSQSETDKYAIRQVFIYAHLNIAASN